MLNYENQLSLKDIYSDCSDLFKDQNPQFLNLISEYIDIDSFIPYSFKKAFYADTGRPRNCSLTGFISALIFQKIFTINTDTLLILFLKLSPDLRMFCGIQNLKDIPDPSQFSRFRTRFADYLETMFQDLVDITEPICKEIDPLLSDMLSYDTSGVESYVHENNPKELDSTFHRLKAYYKFMNIEMSDDDIRSKVFKSLPKSASADDSIRKMYANGHFCYGRKFGIITNGLGIPRHIQFFDNDFKSRHQDFIFEDTDSPDFDKSVADNKRLQPVFNDFYSLHPGFNHSTFLGDATFDAYETYDFLLMPNSEGISLFDKAFIPLNSRASSNKPNCPINEDGIPVCPNDNTLLMKRQGICHEKGRADRVKWKCPKVKMVNRKIVCSCENPCSDAKFGRTAYTTPSENRRLYPGIERGTDEWKSTYKIRGTVEQSINHIKSNMAIAGRKTRNSKSTKADVFLAGIAQLFTVIIANNMARPDLIRSIKKLAC